jgi:2'-5' RNA ligase
MEDVLTGLPEYVRLFTAVTLDPPLQAAIHEEAAALLDGAGRVGTVPVENLHVTLKFIGDVHREDLPALDRVLAESAPAVVSGEIEVEGFGAFPNLRRPRVLWVGVSDPQGILQPVHGRLNEALAPFGAKREKKRFVPHVTIGRVRGSFDGDLVRDRVDSTGEIWMGEQAVDAFVLMMSEMGHGRPPVYSVLGRYGV